MQEAPSREAFQDAHEAVFVPLSTTQTPVHSLRSPSLQRAPLVRAVFRHDPDTQLSVVQGLLSLHSLLILHTVRTPVVSVVPEVVVVVVVPVVVPTVVPVEVDKFGEVVPVVVVRGMARVVVLKEVCEKARRGCKRAAIARTLKRVLRLLWGMLPNSAMGVPDEAGKGGQK